MEFPQNLSINKGKFPDIAFKIIPGKEPQPDFFSFSFPNQCSPKNRNWIRKQNMFHKPMIKLNKFQNLSKHTHIMYVCMRDRALKAKWNSCWANVAESDKKEKQKWWIRKNGICNAPSEVSSSFTFDFEALEEREQSAPRIVHDCINTYRERERCIYARREKHNRRRVLGGWRNCVRE